MAAENGRLSKASAGAHQLTGLEYRYIQGLKVSLPAGTKVQAIGA